MDEAEEFFQKLEKMGEDEVRTQYAAKVFGSKGSKKDEWVLEWLRRKELQRNEDNIVRQEAREIEAIEIAKESNEISVKSNKISFFAIIISFLSLLIAIIALFKVGK